MEGGWCGREFQEKDGEESVKLEWTCGTNGRGRLTKRADVEWTCGTNGRGRLTKRADVEWTCGTNGRGRLTKRADVLRVESRRRRGRLQLRWKDCVNRDGGIGRGVENESDIWGGGRGMWGKTRQ